MNFLQRSAELFLNLDALDESAQRAWLSLVELASEILGLRVAIKPFSGVPAPEGDFAFIADSATLTRKLMLHVPRIYVWPQAAPSYIDPLFHLHVAGREALGECEPAMRGVSLVSSVFRGDEYLEGFLANMGALDTYGDCEHFLIRPASPGNEHADLLAHVRRFPSTCYINLMRDPGLYAVWNFGVSLASGRYVSNANIDDRRAPGQIVLLQAALASHPEAAVASTPLRVTTQKNMGWEASAACPEWFSKVGDGIYQGGQLFKETADGLASRNLPHCMPLWRRSLHVFVGGFNERRYGPSADWAFWLKAARRGARFHFGGPALGLYLRDEGSYWRRSEMKEGFEARIVADFGDLATTASEGALAESGHPEPPGLALAAAVDSLRSGAILEGIGGLLRAAAPRDALPANAAGVFELACRRFLGYEAGLDWAARFSHAAGLEPLSETALLNALVELLHAYRPVTQGVASKRVGRNLALATVDWQTCFDELQGLLLQALLARQVGDLELEQRLLQRAQAHGGERFWPALQSVYRFVRPLPELCEAFSALKVWKPDSGLSSFQVSFYPAYKNDYQPLLYAPLIAAGGQAVGYKSLEAFFGVKPVAGAENVLHLHWMNQIFANPELSADQVRQLADSFLAWLDVKKREGWQVFWTIHNYVSHASTDRDREIAFQRGLYQRADRVFVHHPMALPLLDWLPDNGKVFLCEHGAYDLDAAQNVSREDARRALGFDEADWVVTHVGRVRDYKGLLEVLPTLYAQLEAHPRMHLLIAGEIASPETKAWLKARPHPRVKVKDTFLGDRALIQAMRAADLGLLSYSAILTSGSLAHWMTCGRPVLAPKMGTIPAYLVNGWNGLDYRDAHSLGERLALAASLPAMELERMGQNALATARQMRWMMWSSSSCTE